MEDSEENSRNGKEKTTKIAHRHLYIDVRQAFIDRAMPRDSRHCMIADAVSEQVKNSRAVTVDIATIRFTDKKLGQRFIYLTPPIAQQALVDFDQGNEVKPFHFELRTAIQIKEKGKPMGHRKGTYQRPRIVIASPQEGGAHPYAPPVVIGGDDLPRAPLPNSSSGVITARVRHFGARRLKP